MIKTIGANQATKSFSHYYAFGNHDDVYGSIPNDEFRANTKVEDDDNLLNEGKRFRHLELGIFLTPDPLEYVDGFNPYIYCNQNPWGRWDPEGLAEIFFYFIKEGVGINDPLNGPAPIGYQAKNAEISTNIRIAGTGFTPGEAYILAVDINLHEKGAQTNYFYAKADDKGNIDFGKAANIGQDDGNMVSCYNFEKGKATEILIDIEANVTTTKDVLSKGVKKRGNVPIKNFIKAQNGKPIYEGVHPSKSIFGPQNAHSDYDSSGTDNIIAGYSYYINEKGEKEKFYYAEEKVIASSFASIRIKHIGGAPDATVISKNIKKDPSQGNEKRSNVNITHEIE